MNRAMTMNMRKGSFLLFFILLFLPG
jgi:hypothetical protein